MKLNKLFLTASLLVAGLAANAQETVTEYVFKPHWFGQVQIGGQETLGEGSFGKLLNPNAQIAFGYKFNPYIGVRLAVNGWQSKGAIQITGSPIVGDMPEYAFANGENKYYKWYYVSPTVDAVVDLTNLIGGYNPTRVVEFDLIGGIGTNIGIHNKEAQKLSGQIHDFYETIAPDAVAPGLKNNIGMNPWGNPKWRFVGQLGFGLNFNISSRVQLGLEFMANVTDDKYNSKHFDNTDWYFNCLAGVAWSFGPKYNKVTRVIEPEVIPEPQIVEKIVEKVVEVPAPVVEKKVEVEVLRRDVFFLINQYNIRPQEMEKVAQVAEYLQSHPNAKVTVTGYADKGTGSMAYNLRLSAQRAQSVATALENTYFIPSSRIIVKSMGEDMFQPYPDPVQNRVAICIAE